MPSPEEQARAMVAKLEADSGKSLAWWLDTVDQSGRDKHREKIAFLQDEHGLSYGYANTLVHLAKQRGEAKDGPVDLVESQYAGKEGLRPIYDAIVAAVETFGSDVEIAPKRSTVSLRRSKQFALVEPATKTRIDVGLNLKGHAPTDRLAAATGMCTHKVRITDATEVDDELLGWLRQAYDLA